MKAFCRLFAIGLMVSFVTTTVPSKTLAAQSIKVGDLNGRLAAAADPRDKGKEAPLPCDSGNNPKCEPESKSKPPDGKGKGKGKG